MRFSKRNARYLRVSAHTVLPLYIYLDDRHTEWMSDYVLQRVLVDLKPNIGPKLRRESNMFGGSGGSSGAKSGTLDVHRGDNYQFAYFFRRTEPHAVLIKSRKFIPAPAPPSASAPPTEAQSSSQRKRKRTTANKASGDIDPSKKGSKRRKKSASYDEDESMTEDLERDDDQPSLRESGKRRSGRQKSLAAGGNKAVDSEAQEGSDVEMTDSELDRYEDENDYDYRGSPSPAGQQPGPSGLDPRSLSTLESGIPFSQVLDIDAEEEDKPKMALRVSYQGFTIYDRCLCVVIEPWPALRGTSRAPSRAPSLALGGMRMFSIAPIDEQRQTPVPLQERTPLFLPEIDPRRSLTPAPLPSRILPPVPLFDERVETEIEDEDEQGGMMAFSQVLKSVGDERAGSADEDEDEGDVFLGDADERKGDP